MRTYLLILFFICQATRLLYAQVSVNFSELPANLQLFPRNTENNAIVPISGQISFADFQRVSVVVYRNNILNRVQTQNLNYILGKASFSFRNPIVAELAEYSFKIFACHATDSTLIAFRENIVAGDVYLVSGQSNASANSESYTYKSEYCRSFGKYTGNANYDAYNPSDTLWTYSNQNNALVGVWATELQRQIIETYQIPICIINGASGGSSLEYNIIRNANNPQDLNTTYGRLLYRASKAGVQNAIKAIFWRQGENECAGNAYGYPSNFNTLCSYWQQDFPSVQKTYIFQVNILDYPFAGAGFLRDFQRRVEFLKPNIISVATIGTIGYDGIHYNVDGYKQTGREIFGLVARDFYGASGLGVASPNIIKASYSSAARNEIVLEFNSSVLYTADLQMISTKNGEKYTRKLADFFYLDNQAGLVESGSASGNIVTLKLKQPSNASAITYLPPYFSDAFSNIYDGPLLIAPSGMRALAFYEYYIAGSLAPVPQPTPTTATDLKVNLAVSNILPIKGSTITYTLTVANESNVDANNITIQTVLIPNRLEFVSGDNFVVNSNALVTKIALLKANTTQDFMFVASVNATGNMEVSSEIIEASPQDSDSTPGTGIHDTEDDHTLISINAQPQPSPTTADLSLSMDVTNRTPLQNETIICSIVVRNQGPATATDVWIECTLPNGAVEFVKERDGSSFEVKGNNILLLKIPAILANTTQLYQFFAKVLAKKGQVFIQSEIIKASPPDPDSTPSNGIHDTEDDHSEIDMNITEPMVVPVPAVQQANLTMLMAADIRQPNVGEVVTFYILIRNNGPAVATNVVLKNIIPQGMELVFANGFIQQLNDIRTTIPAIQINESMLFTIKLKAIAEGFFVNKAEICACDQIDPNSTPNNGTDNGEDDTQSMEIIASAARTTNNCESKCVPFVVVKLN